MKEKKRGQENQERKTVEKLLRFCWDIFYKFHKKLAKQKYFLWLKDLPLLLFVVVEGEGEVKGGGGGCRAGF